MIITKVSAKNQTVVITHEVLTCQGGTIEGSKNFATHHGTSKAEASHPCTNLFDSMVKTLHRVM
jgi:hypothetical protein